MSIAPLYIVFYGTLTTASPMFKALQLGNHLEFVCPCEIKGDLYDIEDGNENYPALIAGDGTVKGQLFAIKDPSFLPRADAYEGVDADPKTSLYLRQAVLLQKPDVNAWCYVYNQSVAGCRKITSGDWNMHLRERHAQKRKPPRLNFG